MKVILLGFALICFSSTSRADHHEHCTKDGAELMVSGKTAQDKKKACESKGGTWSEKKAEAPQEQSSGKGGGW